MKKTAIWIVICVCMILFPGYAEEKGYVSVSASATHCLAVSSDGTVWAWGENTYGQLGYGGNDPMQNPVMVSNLENVVKAEAGNHYSIALKEDGTVWAWGENYYGTLGNGTYEDCWEPVQINDLSDISDISVADSHTLALRKDGTVWAWGIGKEGQLGINLFPFQCASPVQVHYLENVTAISANAQSSMALKEDGTVWIWGRAIEEQEDDYRSRLPRMAEGMDKFDFISLGDGYAAAWSKAGNLSVWGMELERNGLDLTGLISPEMEENILKVVADNGQITVVDKQNEVWRCVLDGHAAFVKIRELAGTMDIAYNAIGCLALKKDGTIVQWDGKHLTQLERSQQIPEKKKQPSVVVRPHEFNLLEFSYPEISWQYHKNGNTDEIIFEKGLYITSGMQVLKVSSDLEQWKTVVDEPVTGLAYNGETFVVFNTKGQVLASSDGKSWVEYDAPLMGEVQDVIWDGKRFAAVGSGVGGLFSGAMMQSADGKSWTEIPFEHSMRLEGIAYNGSVYVVTSWDGVFYSEDLVNWKSAEYNQYFATAGKVSWLKDRFIISSGGNTNMYYSYDGIRWKRIIQKWDNWMQNCAYNGNIFMSVGLDATIYVSKDGYYWDCRTEWGDTANSYYDVIWTGEKFVILGRDSILSFSPNDIIKLSVNGRFIPMDSAPIIENDRTLVPARAVFEALQAQVFWEDKTNTAVIRTDFSEIRLQADSSTAVVNGAAVPMDVSVCLVSDRIYLPVRFLAEQLGGNVQWAEAENTIYISILH